MEPELMLNIKNYAETIGAIILTIVAIIILIKIFIKKSDKNENGKIEKGELEEADLKFCGELLKDSIITIAKGLSIQGGLTGKNTYNLMLNQVKNSKKIFEEIEKEKNKNENEKNNK